MRHKPDVLGHCGLIMSPICKDSESDLITWIPFLQDILFYQYKRRIYPDETESGNCEKA